MIASTAPAVLPVAPLDGARFEALALWVVPALVVALLLTIRGGRCVSWAARWGSLALAVLLLWAGLLAGTGSFFASWQAQPEPPPEAFSDGGSLVFVLFLGWIPSGAFLILVRCAASAWIRLRPARGLVATGEASHHLPHPPREDE